MSNEAPSSASLLSRLVRETSHFAALQVVGTLVTWATTLALARLLDERAFGVFAIGTFYLGLGGLLGDGGLGATLLRKREAVTEEEYRNTVTFLLMLGFALAVAFALGAPHIARRYHLAHEEALVLRAMAPLFFVGPLRAVPYIRLERELRFGTIASIELAALFTRQLVAIALAWHTHGSGNGAWALAGAQLSGAAVQLVGAYVRAPGFVGLGIRTSVLAPLLGYGIRVQALGIAAFFKDNVSAMLLGMLVGPSAVGIFDFGLKYAQLPVGAVNALARVQLPAYARFEARDPELYSAVVAVTRTALVVGGAMLVVLATGARAIVPAVYAPRWVASVPVVWGLLPNMAGGLIVGPLFTMLQAQGRAGLALRAFLVWTFATWVLVLVVRGEGLGAIAAAHGVVTVAMTWWLVAWAGRHLARPLWREYVGPTLAGVGAVVGAELSAWRWGAAHPERAGWWVAALAFVLYVMTLLLFDGARTRANLTALRMELRRRR